MIASAEERRPGRGTQGCCVKPIVPDAILSQAFQGWHVERAAESAGLAESHVVDEHNQHIGRALRGAQRAGAAGLRIERVFRDLAIEGRHNPAQIEMLTDLVNLGKAL